MPKLSFRTLPPLDGVICVNLKNAQREGCELSFIWGKMRTIAQQTAFQIALRNCSREVAGRSVLYMMLVEGGCAVKHTCWQRLAASHEEQMSPLMILVLY